MKEIPLRNKQKQIVGYTQVDDADYEILSKRKWYMAKGGKTFYARTSAPQGSPTLMHCIILGIPNTLRGDHKDRNGLNNQRENLRIATHQQNCCNRRHECFKDRPFIGIYQKSCYGKISKNWTASVGRRKERWQQGKFKTPEEAARAYDKKAIEMYGEFAQLNFPKGLLPTIYTGKA